MSQCTRAPMDWKATPYGPTPRCPNEATYTARQIDCNHRYQPADVCEAHARALHAYATMHVAKKEARS